MDLGIAGRKAIVCASSKGLGRACVRLLKRMAFRDLHAHRLWLDVKARNLRAKALYESEGYVVEGTLRTASRASPTLPTTSVSYPAVTRLAATSRARSMLSSTIRRRI